MINQLPSNNYYFKILFAPRWEFIRLIRSFIENFIHSLIKDLDLGKRVSTSTNELIENAVKYSLSDEIFFEIDLNYHYNNRKCVHLKISNTGEAKTIQELKDIMNEIDTDNPQEAYLMRMQKVFERDITDTRSQLGLARIKCEGHADLKYIIEEQNKVSMMAYFYYEA